MYEYPIVLYKPVLIESAEQAEALPIDTIARASWDRVAVKVGRNTWSDNDDTNGRATDLGMVGWTALVPIEAEEEHTTRWDEGDPVNDITHKRRYVTPWEEV